MDGEFSLHNRICALLWISLTVNCVTVPSWCEDSGVHTAATAAKSVKAQKRARQKARKAAEQGPDEDASENVQDVGNMNGNTQNAGNMNGAGHPPGAAQQEVSLSALLGSLSLLAVLQSCRRAIFKAPQARPGPPVS